MSSHCVCDPIELFGYHYHQSFGSFFGVCLYHPRDVLGFIAGLVNLIVISVVQFPQIYLNFKTKKQQMSIFMLLLWNLGDICGSIGLLMQPPGTMLYQQLYYTLIDLTLTGQWFYYNKVYNQSNNEIPQDDFLQDSTSTMLTTYNEQNIDNTNDQPNVNNNGRYRTSSNGTFPQSTYISIIIITILGIVYGTTPVFSLTSSLFDSFSLNTAVTSATLCDHTNVKPWQQLAGSIAGWVCAAIYIPSCLPQIYQNFKRKDTDGYSIISVSLMIFTSSNYQFSFWIQPRNNYYTNNFRSKAFWLDIFPYILSIGVATISYFTMIGQMMYYKKCYPHSNNHSTRQVSLLGDYDQNVLSDQYNSIN